MKNKYRNPQPDIMQTERERDTLEHSTLNRILYHGSRTRAEEYSERVQEPEWWRTQRKQDALNQHNKSS